MSPSSIKSQENGYGIVAVIRPVPTLIEFAIRAVIRCAVIALAALAVSPGTSRAQGIEFVVTQFRVTVPVNSSNATVVTNLVVDLAGGVTNAVFSVSGLPAGAEVIVADTNLNPVVSVNSDTNLVLLVNTTNVAHGIYTYSLNASGMNTNGVPTTNNLLLVLQSAHVWNGALDVGGNWADASSWQGGVPGVGSDVVFGDQGAQTNANGFTNIVVSANTTVGSIRFSQTGETNSVTTNETFRPIFHTVEIAPNTTLSITGTNGFSLWRDYIRVVAGSDYDMNVIVAGGVGSRLVVSNAAANFALLVGAQSFNNPSSLNMSNLNNFSAMVNRMGLADYRLFPAELYRNYNDRNDFSDNPSQMMSDVFFARTNIITALYKDPDNYTNQYTRSYAFTLGNNEVDGNGSSVASLIYLGQSNLFQMDSVCLGGANYAIGNSGAFRFNPLWTNSSAFFRSTNGGRMSMFAIADGGGTNYGTDTTRIQTADFSLGDGVVNILADWFIIARDRTLIASNNNPVVEGTLTMGRGLVDVNTAILGYQEHDGKTNWSEMGAEAYRNYCRGTLNVGTGGVFRVNGTLTLGYTADSNPVAAAEQFNTRGLVSISGGTVTASNIVCDGGLNFYNANLRQNQISILQAGTLVVSNTIGGAPGLPLDSLSIGAGSTLTLFVTPGKTNINVRSLTSSGILPGIIKIASLPAFPVYPTNIALIKYETATPFLAADMSSIGGSVQGYIINNAANGTIDLFLTTNAPQSLVWKGNINNSWDLSTKNWATAIGGLQTNFTMGDIALFDDSTSVTNVDITEVVVPNQATNGVVINNSSRHYVFNPAGGSIAGTASMIKQGSAGMTFNAAESGPITIRSGNIDGSGVFGTTTLFEGVTLNFSGAINGGLTSTGLVEMASGSTINGGVAVRGGKFVNSGMVNVASGVFTVTNNAVATNNADGVINLGANTGGGAGGYEVFVGSSLANFGTITASGGRLFLRGLYFGNGLFYDPVNPASASAFARFNMRSDRNAVLSPGETPVGSIGDLYMGVRVDMHESGPNNNVGTFRVEVDTVNNVNDALLTTRWNNIGCVWLMTNINGSFSSGQSFRVLVNNNGVSVPNFVDTANIWPLMWPAVPGPGLQWNISEVQKFGLVGITNSTMIWDGSGGGTWDTNLTAGNWKNSLVYTNNQGAIFNDSASGTTTIDLNSAVAPAGLNVVTVTNTDNLTFTNIVTTTNTPAFQPGIVVSNATKDYHISGVGKITGITSLYKAGSGLLTVLTSNDFTGGVILDGGTLAITNSSALGASANQVYNQLVVDNNATLKHFGVINQNLGKFVSIETGGATFEVSSNAAQLTLGSNVRGTGTLTKTGPGTLILNQTGDDYAGGTVVNDGALRLTAAAAGPGGIVLNGSSALELTNAFTFTNAINISGSAISIRLLSVFTNVASGAWSGSGDVTFSNNTTALFAFNGNLSAFTGNISLGDSSGTYRFNNATNENPCTGSASASFDLGSGSAALRNFNGGGLTYNLGSLAGGPNTILAGRTSNSVIWPAATTYSIGANGSNTAFYGTIVDGLDTVFVTKVGSGTLLLNGNNSYTGLTTVSSGTLGGTGVISGAVTVSAAGTLSPGASIGTLTINNGLTLGGTTVMEVSRNAGVLTSDKVVGLTSVNYGGTLVVSNAGPDAFIAGDSFPLFNTGGANDFTSIVAPALGGGLSWSFNPGTGVLSVVGSGGSPTLNYSQSGGGIEFTWSGSFKLQSQTNSLSVGIGNNWVDYPGGDTSGITVPVDLFNESVFFRLINQ